jgi:hypothetical protein
MCRMHAMTLSVAIVLLAAGCTKQPRSDRSSTTPKGSAAAKNESGDAVAKDGGPAEAVAQFLEAVRTGNDEAAAKMLSAVTRQRTAALNYAVKPPASDTAKFTIGKVDYVSADGARVACTWTDLDADGQPKTDEAIWVVRRESNGWRIAGVAAQVFPGEAPLLLNFEDPEDMIRKQQWVREEIRRRMEKEEAGVQAQGGEKAEKPIRR